MSTIRKLVIFIAFPFYLFAAEHYECTLKSQLNYTDQIGDTISVALDKRHLWDEVACYDVKTTKGYTYIGKNLCDVFIYKKEFPLGYDIVNFTRCMYRDSKMSLYRISTDGLANKEYRCQKVK